MSEYGGCRGIWAHQASHISHIPNFGDASSAAVDDTSPRQPLLERKHRASNLGTLRFLPWDEVLGLVALIKYLQRHHDR